MAPGSVVLSDGLACFRSVTKAGCSHQAVVTGGKHPNDLPQARWINTMHARRHLGGCCIRFNRRFSLAAMTERIANAVCCCMPCMEGDLRVAEADG